MNDDFPSYDFSFDFNSVERVAELCDNALRNGVESFDNEELKSLGLALTTTERECRRIKSQLRREILNRFAL